MKNFDWDGFIAGRFVVNCKTKEEAEDFFKKCKGKGLSWNSGNKLDDTRWSRYEKYTCYTFKKDGLEYCYTGYYKERRHDVVTWYMEVNVELNVKSIVKEERYYLDTNLGKVDITDMMKDFMENNYGRI